VSARAGVAAKPKAANRHAAETAVAERETKRVIMGVAKGLEQAYLEPTRLSRTGLAAKAKRFVKRTV
jgi:hypothetical protein